jgi:delta24-sterol reductase
MEAYALERKSYVALYAENELTKEDFEQMFEFNLKNYYKMRKKFNCDGAFPHVYEKISKLGRN